MAIDYKTITIKFNERYSNYFDSISNAEIWNRKSDIWLIEKDRPKLWPRAWTSRVWNGIVLDWLSSTAYVVGDYVVSSWVIYKCTTGHTNSQPPSANWLAITAPGQSKWFFYTDRKWVRRLYRVWDKNLQYLNGTTWTNLKVVSTNDTEMSIQRVPLNVINDWVSTTAYVINDKVFYNGVSYICILWNTNQTPPNVTYWTVITQDSTQYTVATVSTGAEKIKKAAGDSLNANNNIGTVLLITNGIYKWCYAPIIAYDSATSEYLLGWSGAITAPAATTTYKRYDTVGDALQVTQWYGNADELYFNGTVENTWIQWYTTASLINIAALSTGQYLKKMVTFNNYSWTFSGSTLFYTGGYPGNPFFFNYTGSLTLGWNGSIIDIFQYKSRLVVVWTNFIFSVTSTLSVDRHITAFGWVKDGYVNTGDDVYLLTTQKTLISMNETINGVVWIQNAWLDIDNYISKFNYNVSFWFDSKKLYLYWEEISGTQWTICVLDIKRKIWIFYTGISPKSFISEWSIMYVNDNNSDIYRIFDSSVTTDVAIGTDKTDTIDMEFTLKEIDLSDIFTPKTLAQIYFSFENYTQSVYVDTYMAVNRVNWKKVTKELNVAEVLLGTIPLGSGTVGENTFWASGMLDIISVPLLEKIDWARDSANIFKIAVSGKDGSPFYMNQVDIVIGFTQEQKTYFDVNHIH